MKHQEIIAKYDGATALSIGWHMGIIMDLGEKKTWDDAKYRKVVQDVIENGALINNLATEPATGSPTRGGRPETTARKEGDKWILNGRKTFATLSPILEVTLSSTVHSRASNEKCEGDLVSYRHTRNSIKGTISELPNVQEKLGRN